MEHKLSDLLAMLLELGLVDFGRVLGVGLESVTAELHEGFDPFLDLALAQVVLPGGVDDCLLTLNDLQR